MESEGWKEKVRKGTENREEEGGLAKEKRLREGRREHLY